MKKIIIFLFAFIIIASKLNAQTKVPDYVLDELKEHPNPPGTYNSLKKAILRPEKVIEIDLFEQGLNKVPDEIRKFKNVEVIDLGYNQISELPDWLCQLKKLKTINLYNNKLTDLPDALFNIQSLENLDVRGNLIKSFDIKGVKSGRLTEMNLSFNQLTEIPEHLYFLQNLEILRIENNSLMFIPSTIGKMPSLKKLYLYHNKINDYDNLRYCKTLELLYLSENPSSEMLGNLKAELPNCKIDWSP
jgi:Leucine-rich repeat (LRR) protein